MENTQNGIEQINDEQLIQGYNKLYQENQYLQSVISQLRSDRSNEQLTALMQILINKDKFSKKIVKLAEWHMQKMLEKPKKSK